MMKWLTNEGHPRPIVLGGVGLLLFVLGFWLAILQPKWSADHAYTRVMDRIAELQGVQETVHHEHDEMINWYTKEYADPVDHLVRQGDEMLAQAIDLASKAQQASDVSVRAQLADQAYALIDTHASDTSVTRTFGKAKELLDTYRSQLSVARRGHNDVLRVIEEGATFQQTFANDVGANSAKFLSKYTQSWTSRLTESTRLHSEIVALEHEVAQLLPPDSDQRKVGDPKWAQILLGKAAQVATTITGLRASVAEEIAFQTKAMTEAGPLTAKAEQALAANTTALETFANGTGLGKAKALRASDGKLATARSYLADARSALSTQVEGTHDYPVAYLAAEHALKDAQASAVLADEVRAQLDRLKQLIVDLQSRVSAAQSTQSELEADNQVLRDNHASESWDDVASVLKQYRNNISQTQSLLQRAKNLSQVEVQQFADALALAEQGMTVLADAGQSQQRLHAKRVELENARSAWPQAKQDASSAITAEEDDVKDYGDYSHSAKSDFDSAKTLLQKAMAAAQNERYVDAVSKALQSKQQVAGTGAKAHDAYDEHVAEEQRKATAAALAVEKAKAAAVERAKEQEVAKARAATSQQSTAKAERKQEPAKTTTSRGDGKGYQEKKKGGDGGGYK